jgi:Holliday junction DNA helicase RuvA
MPGGGGGAILPATPIPGAGAAADALSALLNLGYRRAEAEAALAKAIAEQGDDAALDILIRAGLRNLSR